MSVNRILCERCGNYANENEFKECYICKELMCSDCLNDNDVCYSSSCGGWDDGGDDIPF